MLQTCPAAPANPATFTTNGLWSVPNLPPHLSKLSMPSMSLSSFEPSNPISINVWTNLNKIYKKKKNINSVWQLDVKNNNNRNLQKSIPEPVMAGKVQI